MASKQTIYQAADDFNRQIRRGESINSYTRKHDFKFTRFIYDKVLTEETIFKVFDGNDCNTWTSKFANIIAITNTQYKQTAIYFFELDISILESLG